MKKFFLLFCILLISACSNQGDDIGRKIFWDKNTDECKTVFSDTVLPKYFCTSTCKNPAKNGDNIFIWQNCPNLEIPNDLTSNFLYKGKLFTGSILEIMSDENLPKDKNISIEYKIKKGKIDRILSTGIQSGEKTVSIFNKGIEILNISYYKNGKIRSETDINGNIEHVKMYYVNGKVALELNMRNGVPNDVWKVYDTNGNLIGNLTKKERKEKGIPSITEENVRLLSQ